MGERWRSIIDSKWVQATRKLYAPLEKLDGLLGVWERFPTLVKAGLRMGVYYLVVQIGLGYGARALEVGRDNWYFVVIAALIITLVVGLLIEHYIFPATSGPTGTVVPRKFDRDDTAEGSGEITATGPVHVPEDQADAPEIDAESLPPPGRSLKAVSEEAEFQAAGFVAGHQILEDSVELTLSFLNGPPFHVQNNLCDRRSGWRK